MYTIKTASQELYIDEQYVRKLLKAGGFPGAKQQFIPGTAIMRWEIPDAAVVARKTHKGARSARADGRGKYTVYANAAELAKLTEACTKLALPAPVRANTPEQVAKRVAAGRAKRAAIRAEKANSLNSLKASLNGK